MKKIIFHSVFLFTLALAIHPAYAADGITIAGPDGKVKLSLNVLNGQLYYSISYKNSSVIENSALKMTVDNSSITSGITIGKISKYSAKETYEWNGVHSRAVNHFNASVISLNGKNNEACELEVKVFNNGAAYRIIVPGAGQAKHIPDESSELKIPSGSTLWYHDLSGHYEAIYKKKQLSEVAANEWAAPPLTYKLPGGAGYAAVTEADLRNYSGMALQADGAGAFITRLADKHPISTPYKLRYTPEDTLRVRKPAVVTGIITTPWRVVMVGEDLNMMLNNDMLHNLCPPPDKTLFPDGLRTSWIKPGRAVWRYLDTPQGEASTPEVLAEYSAQAARLGFEHNILEGFWSRWTDDQIRELVRSSKEKNVGIWFWKHSKSLIDTKERQAFFKRCHDLGIAGVKLDFFDHEHKEVVDLYHTILKEAAENKLLVDFHGSNKPTGESRTWPNELTRESVRGMESRNVPDKAVHNTTIPFTRWLAGHAEYTPVHFGERKANTSIAHQIASAAILSAPLLTYAAHPQKLLSSPAVEMIKSIPSTWDETIVLPPSEIGEVAVLARRKGSTWFLAVMNGSKATVVNVPLKFLRTGNYQSLLVSDKPGDVNSINVENNSHSRSGSISIQVGAGSGYIARFSK